MDGKEAAEAGPEAGLHELLQQQVSVGQDACDVARKTGAQLSKLAAMPAAAAASAAAGAAWGRKLNPTASALLTSSPLGLPAPGCASACQPSQQCLCAASTYWPCSRLCARCIALGTLSTNQLKAGRWLCAGAGAVQHAPAWPPQPLPRQQGSAAPSHGLGGEWLRAVKALYADIPMAARTSAGISPCFQAAMGLKQGCPLSTLMSLRSVC